MAPIHSFHALAHPLAQIKAAEEFYGQVDAYIADEWSLLFVDEPPDEDALGAISPTAMLDALASLGLRFEVAAPMKDSNDRTDEGFWATRFRGGSLSALLYSWAYQVMDFVELDHRAFFEGLQWTDLIFVPDRDGVATEAYQLLLGVDWSQIELTEKRHEEFVNRHLRRNGARLSTKIHRGSGPRTTKPAVVDRAAIILQNAKTALTIDELARRMKHKNLASLAAALHQAVNYGKPKRLLNCLHREDTGQYRWVEPEAEGPAKGATA